MEVSAGSSSSSSTPNNSAHTVNQNAVTSLAPSGSAASLSASSASSVIPSSAGVCSCGASEIYRTRLHFRSVHYLVGRAELERTITDRLGSLPVHVERCYIILYGPKSTGKAKVDVIYHSEKDLIEAVSLLSSLQFREQLVHVELDHAWKHERRRKKEQQPKGGNSLPYQEEIEDVRRKYPDTQILSVGPPTVVSLSFKPSDPEFPYDIEKISLQITIPASYPSDIPSIVVQNDDIPAKIKEKINNAWAKRAEAYKRQNVMLVNLLRWLDNRLEELFIDKELTQDYQLKNMGIEIIINDKKNKTETNPSVPSSSSSSSSSSSASSSSSSTSSSSLPGWVSAVMQQRSSHAPQPAKESEKEAKSRTSSSLSARDGKSEIMDAHEGKEEEEEDFEEEEEEEEGEEDDEEDELHSVTSQHSSAPSLSAVTAMSGVQVSVSEIHLKQLGILKCTRMEVVLECERCRKQSQVSLKHDIRFVEICDKCTQTMTIKFRQNIMYEGNSILGYFDADLNKPLDITEIDATGTCLNCSSEVSITRIGLTGTEVTQNCRQCSTKCTVILKGLRLERIRAQVRQETQVVRQVKKKPRDPNVIGIKIGTPLPDHGACKHYRKSKRWLRFPCCRRAFSCDLCHEENNKDGHQMMWATRMICGSCSREQPFQQDLVCVCGEAFGKATTRYWEGGRGHRNPATMTSKDSHKFRGMSKTHSQKAKRVGKKETAKVFVVKQDS